MTDEALCRGAQALGISLQQPAIAQLIRLLDLLAKWNRVYNLTAIREQSRWVTDHLLDCLSVVPQLPPGCVADVGSGAGFPGLPIAVACPARKVSLVESSSKKGAFLQQAVADLELANAEVAVTRVETYRPERGFDVVISRAFAELPEFVRAARHLCAPNGRLLAMKGTYPDEEIAQLPAEAVERVIQLEVPMLQAQRHLVVINPAALTRR